MSQKEGESDQAYSKRVRRASIAFIGSNMANDAELIAGFSNALSLEFGFVGVVGEDKEIRFMFPQSLASDSDGRKIMYFCSY